MSVPVINQVWRWGPITTSCAFGGHVDAARAAVRMRKPREKSNIFVHIVGALADVFTRLYLCRSSPQTNTGRNIVDMLLNMFRNVVFLGRDILGPRRVFPDKILGVQKGFHLIDCRIELNPLNSHDERAVSLPTE